MKRPVRPRRSSNNIDGRDNSTRQRGNITSHIKVCWSLPQVAVNPTSSYIEELDYVSDMLQELSSTSDSESSGEESEGDEDKKTEDAVDEDDQAERAQLPQYISRFKELNSLLESQGKVESSTFKDIVTDFAQQNLAAAEKRDMEEFEERLQTWEAEERQLTQREKEMRAIAEQEKREQLAKAAARAAARAAAQQA